MAGCGQWTAVGKTTADSYAAPECQTKSDNRNIAGLCGLLLFEGEGEFFPLGEEGGALGAEGLELGGVFL